MSLAAWRESIESSRFKLIDFWIVVISGGVLFLFPEFWFWSLLIALIPWGVRIIAGASRMRRTGFEWLVAGFAITAGAGYWASYDRSIALIRFTLILASALLFFALSNQPEENLIWVSIVVFCVGLGVSLYFFLTHDFLESPRKLEIVNTMGHWIMQIRPSFFWTPIHPNYVSGIAAMTSPFIVYPLWRTRNAGKFQSLIPIIAVGLGIILFAILMSTSRGVLMAIASAAGAFLLWRIVRLSRINLRLGGDAVFPSLILIYLAAIVLLLYLGPAAIGGNAVQSGYYGDGSRAELFVRSTYLVADFPFTGGGLGSYPALYSHYMLGIPYYFLPNAHNLFLDVFIEQGIPGGLIFFTLFVTGIWQAARTVVVANSPGMKIFGWLALIALIMAFVHGMVDDYLYTGKGAILSMVPVGLAAIPMRSTSPVDRKTHSQAGFVILSICVLIIGLLLKNLDRARSAWHANIGAVQMARIELEGFPPSHWAGSETMTALASTEISFLSSVAADPANRTANHRLGLIAMISRDFSSAVLFLEEAKAQSPGHSGINKALGYCYVWLGEFEKAQLTLAGIPEASDELDVYIWWWQVQGRHDLSERASAMQIILLNPIVQP